MTASSLAKTEYGNPATCTHPDSYGRWKYIGDSFDGAFGYCRDCETSFAYCVKAKKLVPTDQVIERFVSAAEKKKVV